MESTQVLSEDESINEYFQTQMCYHMEIRSSNSETRYEDLTRGCSTIGREKEDVVIHLDSATVSRIHAQIILEEDGLLTLEDLGSANKTWKNTCKLQPHVRYSLQGDEALKFGDIQVFLRQGSRPPRIEDNKRSPILIPETPFVIKRRRSIVFDEGRSFVPSSQSSPLSRVDETNDDSDNDDDVSFVPATQREREENVASLLNEETQKITTTKEVIFDSDEDDEVDETTTNKNETTQNESGLFFLPTQKLNGSTTKPEEDIGQNLTTSNSSSDLIKIKFPQNTSNVDQLLFDGIFSQDGSHINDVPVEDKVGNVSDAEPVLLSTQELLNGDEGSFCSQESEFISSAPRENSFPYGSQSLSLSQKRKPSEDPTVSNRDESLLPSHVIKDKPLIQTNEVNTDFEYIFSFVAHHVFSSQQSTQTVDSDEEPNQYSVKKSTPPSDLGNENKTSFNPLSEEKENGPKWEWPHFLSISFISHVVLKLYDSESCSSSSKALQESSSNGNESKKTSRRSSRKQSTLKEKEVPTKLKQPPTLISLRAPPRPKESPMSVPTSSKRRFSLDVGEDGIEDRGISPKNPKRSKKAVEAVPNRRSTRLQKTDSLAIPPSSPKENSKRKSARHSKDEPKEKTFIASATRVKVEPLSEIICPKNSSEEELNIKPEPRRTRKSKTDLKSSGKRNSNIKVKVEPEAERPSRRSTMNCSLHGSDSSLNESRRSSGRRRFKPVVMFTGYDDIQNDSKTVKELGGSVTDNVKDCNLAVMNKLRRTVKLVAVVGKGVPIVDPNYLLRSKEAKYFLDPWKYLIADVDFEKNYSCVLRSTLRHAEKRGLLSDFEVYLTKSVEPPSSQFQSIVECAGGRFLKNLRKKKTEGVIVVSCPKDLNIYTKHVKAGFIVVSKELLLTGILKHELDFKTFSLK